MLVVAGAVLLVLQCVKFAGVLSAIRWIVVHGQEFGSGLREHAGHFPKRVYWDLLDRAHGRAVFPFGVLEYRLMRYAARRGPLPGRLLVLAHRLFFDFTGLGLLVAGYLFLAGTPALHDHAQGPVPALAWASGGLAALQLIAIYAEACVSYARIGSYGMGFHGAGRYAENRRAGAYFTEAKTLAGAVIYSLTIGTLILYFGAGHGARFGSLAIANTGPIGVVTDLLDSLYFAITTFFTADTADPQNGLARLATVILVAQAACALILAATTATIYIAPEPPPSTKRRRRPLLVRDAGVRRRRPPRG